MVQNSLTDCILSCFCLQVLQYNVEARTWTQIDTLQRSSIWIFPTFENATKTNLCSGFAVLAQWPDHLHSSRLPCYVFCICLLPYIRNIRKKPNQLSLAINHLCHLHLSLNLLLRSQIYLELDYKYVSKLKLSLFYFVIVKENKAVKCVCSVTT